MILLFSFSEKKSEAKRKKKYAQIKKRATTRGFAKVGALASCREEASPDLYRKGERICSAV